MKRALVKYGAALAAVMLSHVALAQEDLEVTLEVVPPGASADAAIDEIRLPDHADPEAKFGLDTANRNAEFGLDTANKARALRDELGEQFGRDVSDAARDRAEQRIPNIDRP